MASKANKTFSLGLSVIQRLDYMAKDLEKSMSELAERYIEEGLARDSIISLKCPICGASYSSKLTECPGCRK